MRPLFAPTSAPTPRAGRFRHARPAIGLFGALPRPSAPERARLSPVVPFSVQRLLRADMPLAGMEPPPAARPTPPSPRRHWWATALPALLVLAAPAPAEAPGFPDARSALIAAKQAAADAEAHAAALNQAADEASDEATRARARAAALGEQVHAAQADIAAAQSRIALIATLQASQRSRIADKQGPILRLIAALQTMARRPPGLALTQPGSVADIVHVRLLLADTLPIIAARTATLRAELQRQTQLRADAERAVAALTSSRALLARRQQALALIEATALRRSQRLADQAADEEQRALGLGDAARDAADQMQTLADAGDVRARLSTLPDPQARPFGADPAVPRHDGPPRYRLPVTGTIETGYGEVSDAGVRARGLTVTPAPGSPVIAPAAGTIVYAGPFRSYGRVVIIAHGGGWTTTLTGLATLAVKVGDTVRQGSPIGHAGGSGATVTAELRRDNRPVDLLAMAQAG